MNTEIITAFVAFAFVSSITPGPNNLMLMASGTNYGFRMTIPHILGVAIGFTLMIILVGIGLIKLFDIYPVSYQILKGFSIIYLLYLAWKIATSAPIEKDSESLQHSGKPLTFLQAALFQWVNPKALAMALTAISAYTPESHSFVNVVIVAVIFGLINLPSISTWVVIGTQMRRFLTDPKRLRVFNFSAAILLVGSLYPILFNTGV